MQTAVVFEHSEHAILIVRFVVSPDEQQFAAYIDELTRHLHDNPRFGYVFEIVGEAAFSAAQRKAQAAWIGQHYDMLHERCFGAAFVISSAIARLVLSSIMLLQRSPHPTKVVGSRAQALEWLAERATH